MTDAVSAHGLGHHLYQVPIGCELIIHFLRADHPATALWGRCGRGQLRNRRLFLLLFIENLAIQVLLELFVIRGHILDGCHMSLKFVISLCTNWARAEVFNHPLIENKVESLEGFGSFRQIGTRDHLRFRGISCFLTLVRGFFWVCTEVTPRFLMEEFKVSKDRLLEIGLNTRLAN